MRVAKPIVLEAEIRRKLEQQARGRSTPVRVAQRSRIVLLAADGLQNEQIAAQMETAPRTVARWRERFLKLGICGLVERCCAARTDPVDFGDRGRPSD